jgi:hypothetical protein
MNAGLSESARSRAVGVRYGISAKTVRDIWNRITWNAATEPLWTDQVHPPRRTPLLQARTCACIGIALLCSAHSRSMGVFQQCPRLLCTRLTDKLTVPDRRRWCTSSRPDAPPPPQTATSLRPPSAATGGADHPTILRCGMPLHHHQRLLRRRTAERWRSFGGGPDDPRALETRAPAGRPPRLAAASPARPAPRTAGLAAASDGCDGLVGPERTRRRTACTRRAGLQEDYSHTVIEPLAQFLPPALQRARSQCITPTRGEKRAGGPNKSGD